MTTQQMPPIEPRTAPVGPALRTGWKALETLPEGPLDLIGDIHGEIDALGSLLGHLGYQPDGEHSQRRRVVFVGDLIDRGPDSPGVVRRIAGLVDAGRAFTVMGNHDLNAIAGRHKSENTWLFGHGPVSDAEKKAASEAERKDILGFLRSQPLAMERSDLRVVHACWNDDALRSLTGAHDPVQALEEHRARIKSTLATERDVVAASLALQNQNPIKLITSGPEVRAAEPYFAAGQMRTEARHPWWDTYTSGPAVVFGHYWRIPLSRPQDDGLFAGQPFNSMLGDGRALCIDFSVGGRAAERAAGRVNGPFTGRLAALRWPERELVFDDGERQRVLVPAMAS